MERRLQRRYGQLVTAHANVTQSLSAGMKAVADANTAFAHTQALWRFLRNDRVTLPALAEPVRALAQADVPTACDAYALAIHDWSRLNYRTHTAKGDRVQMTHALDVGYELQSSVLASDRDGGPVAVPVQNLVTAAGVWQSRHATVQEKRPHLDELTERMMWLEGQAWGKPLVHIVDREADSVAHLRQWQDWQWLVRVKGGSRVRDTGADVPVSAVAAGLTYTREREVAYHGRPAIQWIAQTTVVLARPAKPKRTDAHGRRVRPAPGAPLAVRLVASRVCDAAGGVLAEWFLLTNLPATVPAERVALWYYHRWTIESFFKLLKSAGHQLESWGQESGPAIAKRLLIATQACAMAWRLMRKDGPHAAHARNFLVRLSGRQMKRSRPVTPTALLDGLFTLLTMLEALEHHTLDELKHIARIAVPIGYPGDV